MKAYSKPRGFLERGVGEISEMVLIEQHRFPETLVRLLITGFGVASLVLFLGLTELLAIYVVFALCLLAARHSVLLARENPTPKSYISIFTFNVLAALIFIATAGYFWFMPGLETKVVAMAMVTGSVMFSVAFRNSIRSFLLIEGTVNTAWFLFLAVYFISDFSLNMAGLAAGLVMLGLAIYHWLLIADQLRGIESIHKARERSLQAQKMESLGRLTGGISHNYNNILAAILGNLELYREAKTEREKDELVAQANEAANRASELTAQLVSFSKRSQLMPSQLKLPDFLKDFHFLASRVLPDNIDVKFNTHDGLWPVVIDQNRLENALLSLVINARDAMSEGGALSITASNFVLDTPSMGLREAGPYVRIDIKDDGEGIPAEKIHLVFDPFFTTKEIGLGSGLGLSMAKGFAEQSGGTVMLNSAPQVGTEVNLILPAQISSENVT